jgi:hypothetical protein
MAAKATPRAMQRLIELVESEDERVALIACEAVILRGAGKVRDHAADEQRVRADLSALSPEQRRALAQLLAVAVGEAQGTR